MLRLWPLIQYLWKNPAENVDQMLVPEALFYFGKQPKTAISGKKIYWERYWDLSIHMNK